MPLAETCGLGTNALRSGAPKAYSGANALVGNWPDERKDVTFNGVRPENRTMYQQQVDDGELRAQRHVQRRSCPHPQR